MSYDKSYERYNQARECFTRGDFALAAKLFEESNALFQHFKTLELWNVK